MQKTAQTLKSSDNILILPHYNPDGDAIGSSRALFLALKSLGKRVRIETCGDIMEKLIPLIPQGEAFKEELIVAIDTGSPDMLGGSAREKYGSRIDFVIDHHSTNPLYGAHNVVKGDYASCAEVVLELLDEMGVAITRDIARSLYTSVVTDTGCFRHSNTTSDTHRRAARLMELAGDVSDINYTFATEKNKITMALEKRVLSNLLFFCEGRCAFSHITLADFEDVGGTSSHAEDLKDIPRTVEGVIISAFFKETACCVWRVSVRTNKNLLDASKVCLAFGGGGHFGAAACNVYGTLEEAQEKFKNAMIQTYGDTL